MTTHNPPSDSALDDYSIEAIELGAVRDRAEGVYVMAMREMNAGDSAKLHDAVLPALLEFAAKERNDGDALLGKARALIDDAAEA